MVDNYQYIGGIKSSFNLLDIASGFQAIDTGHWFQCLVSRGCHPHACMHEWSYFKQLLIDLQFKLIVCIWFVIVI